MFRDYFDLFAGKDESEQLDIMEQLLIKQGFTEVDIESRGCETVFFEKDGMDNVYAFTRNSKGAYLSIILPKDFIERHYKEDGKFTKIIRLKSHSNKNGVYSPVMDYNGKDNVYLHRVLMMELDYDIDGKEVDHKNGHHGVDTPEELRVCTTQQNLINKKSVKVSDGGEFAYNPLHDFRDSFWIPFLHYVLGVISYDDMAELRKMELV